MLDILDLAQDSNKNKTAQKQNISKQERFNQIMNKLRERNVANDFFIKKYIKKSTKKKCKLPEITCCIGENTSSIGHYQTGKGGQRFYQLATSKTTIQRREKDTFTTQEIVIKNSLKDTNHTLTEQTLQEQNKITSFPNIDLVSNKTHSQILSNNKVKPNIHNFRQDKSFNKYLRNVFFNEANQKIETKQTISNSKEYKPRKSQARITTQMSTSAYQLSIKSLVFGIQDSRQIVKRQEKKENYQQKMESATKQIIKNMDKYQRDYQFYDDKLTGKGMLPVIHNFQPPKNRRFLEKYIKFNNNERPTKLPSTETKVMTLPTESEVLSGRDTPHRIGLGLRIQTIQMQKQN